VTRIGRREHEISEKKWKNEMTQKKSDIDYGRLRYQSFEVEGQKTAGHDRSYLLRTIFDDPATGKSYLDIGSFLGYFCVEAMKRGAASATGIEPDLESLEQARALAQASSVAPEYIHGDFESHDFGTTRFDTVLCLNVLHHMFDSVAAVRKTMRLAREKVVIEFATPTIRDMFNRSLNPFTWMTSMLPVIVLGNPKKSTDIASRTFVFTAKAMRVLFEKHTAAFEPVTITKSPFKGRLVLEARRRNLGHVTFVAGPSSSGKSTTFEKILKDPGHAASLGLKLSAPTPVHGHEIDLPNGRNDEVLVHYDILRPYRRSIRSVHRDPRCDLLHVAEKASVVTLVVAPKLLQKQLLKAHNVTDPASLPKRHKHLYECYADPSFLRKWYGSWFEYLKVHAGKTVANTIVVRDGDGRETLADAAKWLESFDKIAGPTATA